MARNFRKLEDGLNLVPKSTTTVDSLGDLDVSSSDSKLNFYNGTSGSPVVTEAHTATLTNKTIDANNNTILNLTNANLSGSAGITGANIASATITGSNIASSTVANSNLSTMAANTIKGNNTGSPANPSDLTATQTTAMLNPFVGDSGSGGVKGLVPAPAAGDTAAAKFLKADGTWQTVTGSGVTTIGAIDSQPKSPNALTISGVTLYAQSADATNPGMVTASNQTFAGTKTFNNPIQLSNINSNGSGIFINATDNNDITLGTAGPGRVTISTNRPMQIYNQNGIFTPPISGFTSLYFKLDNKLYSMTTGGVETLITEAPGVIKMYGGTSAPEGYLLCDGSAVSRTTYVDLFTAIGTAYGIGDGSSTFNLPDFRGIFPRGVDNGAGNDPDAASRTAVNGGNSGDNVGSFQTDQFASHQHQYSAGDTLVGGVSPFNTAHNAQVFRNANTTSSVGGNETRPKNLYVNFIVKI